MSTANLIDVDAFLPEDIIVRYDGRDLLVPGDVAAPDVLDLIRCFNAFGEAEEYEVAEVALERLHAKVLAILRIRQPDLELALGMRALVAIASGLVNAFGATAVEEVAEKAGPPSRRTRSTTAPSRRRSATAGKPTSAASGS